MSGAREPGVIRAACPGDAGDGVDRMAQQIAEMDTRPAAQPAHRVAHLLVDKRVDDDCSVASARACDGTLEVGDRLAARMPHLFELLFRKLRFERLNKPRGRLAGGVGDDVALNGHEIRLIAS